MILGEGYRIQSWCETHHSSNEQRWTREARARPPRFTLRDVRVRARAALAWLTGNEERGLGLAVSGLPLSLVALLTLYYYLSQFSAVTGMLLQEAFLQVLLAYCRWYPRDITQT